MTRLLPLLWIASVALASTAHAEPTKVALAIEGDSSSIGLRKAVVNAFDAEDDVQFVSSQKTTRAIEQLGIGEVHSAKDARTVAKKLAVAAVVQGEFDESDQTLTLIVYANGKTGSFTLAADDTKSAAFKKNVRKRMFAKLDGAANADSSASDDSATGSEDIKARAGKKGRKTAGKSKKHGDEDEETASDKKSDSASDKKHGSEDADTASDESNKKTGKNAGKADKKSGKNAGKTDKHNHDDEDVAADEAGTKSGKDGDKAEKKTGKNSDKASKRESDEDVADDKADKKSGKNAGKADKHNHDDEDVATDEAGTKSGKTGKDNKHGHGDEDIASDKKTGKNADKVDKKHGHGDEDIADDKADTKSGKTGKDNKHGHGDEEIASDKKTGKSDKKHGHGDDDIADDKADTKGGKSGKDADKGDKKHGHGDDDIADDKADTKGGKSGKDADKGDKKHGGGDEDIAADKKTGKNAEKADKHGHDDEDIASDNKKHGDDEDVSDDKAGKKHGDDEDDDSDDDSGSKVASDGEDPTAAHAVVTRDAPVAERNFAAVRVDFGASMIGRSLRFQSAAVDGAPSDYHAKPVPGGHLDAELYPLAFGNPHRVRAGLGLGGDFDQARSFTIPTVDGFAGEKVTERSYSVGARFRIAFGHHATSPTVTLGAGYGTRTFATDHSSGMATGVPDVAYRMFVPSLVARVPIGAHLTAFAGGRGILMLSAGPITSADQYGRAHAVGGTATAGLEVGLASHVALRFAAEGTQIDLKFYGQGTLSSMLDGDPSTIDVQRARDRYYGGDATIAVTY